LISTLGRGKEGSIEMRKSTVRVVPGVLVFGGWKGELTFHGDVLMIHNQDARGRHISIDIRNVQRSSFNSNNGLWVFRLKDGSKVRIQSAGRLFSADRTPDGRAANEQIKTLLAKHGIRDFSI
jgi:hypothetical protein